MSKVPNPYFLDRTMTNLKMDNSEKEKVLEDLGERLISPEGMAPGQYRNTELELYKRLLEAFLHLMQEALHEDVPNLTRDLQSVFRLAVRSRRRLIKKGVIT